MSLEWIHEPASHWDDDKARIIGRADRRIFDSRLRACQVGDSLPGDWWRVVEDGRTIGYGWLDIVWGDAEVQIATDASARGRGVGAFIVKRLEEEAKARGLNRLYNIVRPHHPDREKVSAWLRTNGFRASEDGSLFRIVV